MSEKKGGFKKRIKWDRLVYGDTLLLCFIMGFKFRIIRIDLAAINEVK